MLASFLLSALSLSVLTPMPSSLSVSGSSGNATRPADNTAVIDELVDRFSDTMRNRSGGRGRDPEAAFPILRELAERFGECGPNDQKDIVNMVVRAIERFDRDESEERELVLAAANALGSMGAKSVDQLLDLVEDNRIGDDLELFRRLILSLGRTQDERGLLRLKKLLHHGEPAIQAAAAEALGEFEALEEGKRKQVFYALLTRLLDAKDLVDQDRLNQTNQRRFDTIIGAVTTSLQRLSRHDERDPEQWQRFWNKNKRKSWSVETH